MWLRCVTFPPQTWRRPQGCRHFSVHACALRPVSYSGRAGLPAAAAIPSRRDRMRYSIKGSAMTVTLPVPTLDHVVVNVRDRIDAGLATYRRLGFTMTPRGYHTLGSMNHLAIFGTEGARDDQAASAAGLTFCCFTSWSTTTPPASSQIRPKASNRLSFDDAG